jgi:hypothetical protein
MLLIESILDEMAGFKRRKAGGQPPICQPPSGGRWQ